MTSDLIPSDKFDLAAIERARAIGFPALNDSIPALLAWLQDTNWPVFNDTADLLSAAGPALLPHVRGVFASEDADWIAALLSGFCPRLPDDLLARIAPDIEAVGTRFRDHEEISSLVKRLTQ